MFEKSLYDLIRGLRNHKGNERAYIQDSIRECRREIKSQDMDLKATALMKLTYLEMFGHDMSWASFNVLEVMSSPKYAQKRVGYLSAVQSFRPDTEVLMLAENLLKKDLTSPHAPIITLPLIAIPHVISASMANSLLSDLLPRMSHSNPSIRKKTIVTLYRLALVYPETLRPAWPRIKERLSDETESPSVIAAIVNVVCELGWRRPQDFLPLAPRLFDLLVEGNNNWMAIKIIKLFATLTPLEPRLTKKLLPPLTTIIKSTPAMSLLYECINGIIQGGILQNASGTTEGDELARLCIGKLRGMLMVQGDPNLKYVALLAFHQIVLMHPYLVSLHEDAILECIDDPDTSIRLRALDLAVGMVNAQNLISIVDRLIAQLRDSSQPSASEDPMKSRSAHEGVTPAADPDEDDAAQSIEVDQSRSSQQLPPLPAEYRVSIVGKILDMCSRDTYANINDFDWYVQVLLSLVRQVPASSLPQYQPPPRAIALAIGTELQNVAIRVKSSRHEAVRASESLIAADQQTGCFPSGTGGQGVLGPAAWVVGEFARYLSNPHGAMSSLVHPDTLRLPDSTLSNYLRSAIKVFAFIASDESQVWTAERKTIITLLTAPMIHFLEPLSIHPDLEVQEQAVQYLELLRLANEAVSAQATNDSDVGFAEPPLLLTKAIPSLFTGPELKPVAQDAQRKVQIPGELDLDELINPHLPNLLHASLDSSAFAEESAEDLDFNNYYSQKPMPKTASLEPAAKRLLLPDDDEPSTLSYQNNATLSADFLDPQTIAKRRAQRRERHKDDPFYIPAANEANSGTSSPVHDILRKNNGPELDIDSIPIMELNLDDNDVLTSQPDRPRSSRTKQDKKPKKRFEILGEETIDTPNSDFNSKIQPSEALKSANRALTKAETAKQKSLLQVDSSGLKSFSLREPGAGGRSGQQLDVERREAEEAEMAAAVLEVERLRLEMQRAQERVESGGGAEVVVKRKKKKAKLVGGDKGQNAGEDANAGGKTKKKKLKKKTRPEVEERWVDQVVGEGAEGEGPPTTTKNKKKRREVVFDERGGDGGSTAQGVA